MKQEENPVLDIVTSSLEDGKAEDVVVIDLRGKTSIANEWWWLRALPTGM